MSTVMNNYYHEIINDNSMSDWDIKNLINMLEEYLDEQEEDE